MGGEKSGGERLPALGVGTRVTANWLAYGSYYTGKIVRVNADGTYAIDYDDGDKETNVSRGLIRLEGDHVGVISYVHLWGECWRRHPAGISSA